MITGRLRRMDQPGSMPAVVRQIESIRALGAEVEVLEIQGLRQFKYLQAILKLPRLLDAADLVHAHYGYCGWVAHSQRQKPVVLTFMGSDLLGEAGRNGRATLFSRVAIQINRCLARGTDAVIVQSAEMARIVAPAPAYIVPNGVDLQLFRPLDPREARALLGWAAGTRYILFPGWPENVVKGFPLAREVVQTAARTIAAPLQLVPLRNIKPHLVPLYMNASHALLLTSLSEGSPNVVKEAMACNLPVVSVPVGDVAALLADAEVSAVCRRDPGVLAAALVQVLSTERRSNGRAALRRLGLDLESVARQIMGIYENVLTRQGRTGTEPGTFPKQESR